MKSSITTEVGFEDIHLIPAVLRRELGSDVEGWVVPARVQNNASDGALVMDLYP